ncbi:MAG: TolC family protein [Elusimicrobia bacterium]|nr:TolC family protein [Elusimicrobiota bacterium]
MKIRYQFSLLIFLLTSIVPINIFSEEQSTSIPLSLQDCIRIALEKSPDLSISKHRLSQATAQLRKTYAPFSPQGTFSANQTQLGYDQFSVLNKGTRWDSSTRNATLSTNWNLFNGFRDWDKWKGAKYDREAAAETLMAAQRQIIIETIQTYYGLLLADKSIEAQKENLKSKQEHYQLAQARFKAGVRSYSDVLNAQIQMKQSEIQLIDTESKKKSSLFALNILLDLPISNPTTIIDELRFEPIQEDLEQNIQMAFTQRPEVLQAQDELHSTEAGRSLAYHDFLPVLSLGGLYNYTVSGTPTGISNRNPFWQFNLGLNFPFWDGGVRLQEILRTREGVKIAEENLERVRRTVKNEVAEAYLNSERNQKVYQVAKDQVQAAKEDLKIVSERYKTGAASVLEVVDAQANLLTVQLDAIQSLYNFHIAKFKLKRAVGLTPM